MKIVRTKILLKHGSFFDSTEFQQLIGEIEAAVEKVVWPLSGDLFAIKPVRKGNGVKPIKQGCMNHLSHSGWLLENRLKITSEMNPGPLDATKYCSNGALFALEWEAGNISSSHRAINKMALGILAGILNGGILILPSRKMYYYLTDRVGNYQEIAPYFPVWSSLGIKTGYLGVMEIEHDQEDEYSPLIPKGNDGVAGRQ